MSSSFRKSVLNSVSSTVLQLLIIISGLVIQNLILRTYGSSINGLTVSIAQILNYLSLVEAGIGNATIVSLYRPLTEKNWVKVNSIVSATRILFSRTGVIFLAISIIVAIVFPIFITSQVSWFFAFAFTLIMSATSSLEYLFHGKYRVLLTADQHLYVVSNVHALSVFASFIARAVLIVNGFDFLLVQSVAFIAMGLRIRVLRKYIKIKYPEVDFHEEPNFSFVKKRWSVLIHQLAGMVVYQTDVVVLTIFSNLRVVSVYAVYNFVVSNIRSLITNILSTSTIASLGQLIASKQEKKIRVVFDGYETVYFFVISVVTSTIIRMILPFISIYTRGVEDISYVDYRLAILFSLIFLIDSLRSPGLTLINASGHYSETKNSAIIESIINVSISLALVGSLGVYGVLLGTVISFIYRTIDIVHYSNNRILSRSSLITIRKIITCIACLGISLYLSDYIIPNSIETLESWILNSLMMLFISTIIAFPIFYIFEQRGIRESIQYSRLK